MLACECTRENSNLRRYKFFDPSVDVVFIRSILCKFPILSNVGLKRLFKKKLKFYFTFYRAKVETYIEHTLIQSNPVLEALGNSFKCFVQIIAF